MKQNKDSFYQVISWGQEHKCSVITDYAIMARSDCSTDNLENRLSKNELKEVIQKIAENDVVYKEFLSKEKCKIQTPFDSEERVCGIGLSTLCMVANGNIYPCAGWQQYVCGNIRNNSLKEIWENSSELNYLRTLRLKDFKKCKDCHDYDYCQMCVARNYNESINKSMFDIPQITCDAAKIHHNIVKAF